MRRKDREITESDRIQKIIDACQCMRIALADGACAYIVPVNFGYDKAGKAFYFHGAAKGRKIDLIRQNGYAGFEMDTDHRLVTADEACGFSFEYSSIIGKGRITVVDDLEEKRHGLDCIMEHMAGGGRWEYPDPMLKLTAVIRLDVEEQLGRILCYQKISCRRLKRNGRYQAGRIQMKQLTPLRGRSWNLTPSIL